MAAEYVVAYEIFYANNDVSYDGIYECFRGSKRRCDDIARGFAGVTDECRPVKFSAVVVIEADKWDEFSTNSP